MSESESAEGRFATIAADQGYGTHQREVMVDAAATMRLPLALAADWLAVGITPWGSRAWHTAGFASAAEARPFRTRGLTPELAALARDDARAAQADARAGRARSGERLASGVGMRGGRKYGEPGETSTRS